MILQKYDTVLPGFFELLLSQRELSNLLHLILVIPSVSSTWAVILCGTCCASHFGFQSLKALLSSLTTLKGRAYPPLWKLELCRLHTAQTGYG